MEEDEIRKALLKKALGYDASEELKEFSFNEEGEKALSKMKVTTKHFAPDISAIKLLLERYYKSYEDSVLSMTDDELEAEEKRLEKLIKEEGESGDT